MHKIELNRKVIGVCFLGLSFVAFIAMLFFQNTKSLEIASLISLFIGIITIPTKKSNTMQAKNLLFDVFFVLIALFIVFIMTKK